MSLLRSKLEAEVKASIVIRSSLEFESKAIGSRRSKAGDIVGVFELNSVTGSERLGEGD